MTASRAVVCCFPAATLIALVGTLAILVGCATMDAVPGRAQAQPLQDAAAEGQARQAAPPAEQAADVSELADAGTREDAGADAAAGADEREARLMVYHAELHMVVSDIRASLNAIQAIAEDHGGYLQETVGNRITIRVPARAFHQSVSRIQRLGEMTDRHVVGEDVTEQMRDLNIRLETAEKMRQRLLALAEKAEKLEDAIRIERELSRVIEKIEQLKGQIRYLESRIAYSTIRVRLNSPQPQRTAADRLPFEWVRQLGDGAVTGRTERAPDTSRWRRRAVRFDVPEHYVRYFERDGVAEAMSAGGVLVRLNRHENHDGGSLAFWSRLCRRALVEHRAIAIEQAEEIKLDTGVAAHMLIGERDTGQQRQGYLLMLVATSRHVHAFEAWGPVEAFESDLEDIKAMARSLSVRR